MIKIIGIAALLLCLTGCVRDNDAIYYPVGDVDIERGGLALEVGEGDVLVARSFIVSGLTSLIHFEFIFVYGVRKCSSFILLQVVDQFSQHHLLKRLSLIHCIFLPPLSKIRCP